MYIHVWKDKETGQLSKMESRIADSLEEAVSDYYQEHSDNSPYRYEYTLVIQLDYDSAETIDIEEHITSQSSDNQLEKQEDY